MKMLSLLIIFVTLLECVAPGERKHSEDTIIETRIEETTSSGNLTVVAGETVMLVCTVLDLGDKSVSWVRIHDPIPQLMSLNNVTNSLNPRFKVLVTDWKEFVLLIKNIQVEDGGPYQCQISGPKHTSLTRTVVVNVIEGATEILDGPIIYVDPKSTLVLTCRVDFGDKTPEYIIWRKENKILKFLGGEDRKERYLDTDAQGRHLARLTIKEVKSSDSGKYFCQPAIGPQHSVQVHVVDRYTDVLPVLGEDPGGDKILVSTLSEKSAAPNSQHQSTLVQLIVTYIFMIVNICLYL